MTLLCHTTQTSKIKIVVEYHTFCCSNGKQILFDHDNIIISSFPSKVVSVVLQRKGIGLLYYRGGTVCGNWVYILNMIMLFLSENAFYLSL